MNESDVESVREAKKRPPEEMTELQLEYTR